MSNARDDRLSVQHVPPTIYEASYPMRIFSAARLAQALAPSWRIVADSLCEEGKAVTSDGFEFDFRGWILSRVGARSSTERGAPT
jgi:hypothetical protein